jgi:hypothetical protein
MTIFTCFARLIMAFFFEKPGTLPENAAKRA